jgi:hypothetical protein
MFILAMNNREGSQVHSRELRWPEAFALAPFLAAIGLFAFYPQIQLQRSDKAVVAAISRERAAPLSALIYGEGNTLGATVGASKTGTSREP